MSHTETAEKYRVVDLLRRETVGGFLLVGAALVAIVVANTPPPSTPTRRSATRPSGTRPGISI
ncbi:hypothetical protein ACFOJ6_05785 [Gordonia humi]|uniref:hypothetical protein n=1 Tax=Gordonia humi TaxID=686429 RepID=UPI00361AC1FA